MRRLLVNDALSQLGERTFWHLLQEWFEMEFVGGDYATLAEKAKVAAKDASLIIRNATWFPPIVASGQVPTISLLQDILPDGETRKMQDAVLAKSTAAVFNSEFTRSHYGIYNNQLGGPPAPVVPLPVDFSVFEPQDSFACRQALSLPRDAVCWIGASQGAAGYVKGFDVFLQIVRLNPDLSFVGVFKDAPLGSYPPNLRVYVKLSQADLVRVIGACRVGLCTSRTESQHLAGIEMGACGLPMVAPPVGAYWDRDEKIPGRVIIPFAGSASDTNSYVAALRAVLTTNWNPQVVRAYWRAEFDIPVVRAAWTKLVEEVECSGAS